MYYCMDRGGYSFVCCGKTVSSPSSQSERRSFEGKLDDIILGWFRFLVVVSLFILPGGRGDSMAYHMEEAALHLFNIY